MSDDRQADRQMTREDIVDLINETEGLDRKAMTAAAARWKSLCKPLGSLGLLEEQVVTLAGIQGTPQPSLERCAVYVFCADNGVVDEGVSQAGREVTATVVDNFVRGVTTVNAFSAATGAELRPVDVGVYNYTPPDGVLDRKIMPRGTNDIAKESAMSEEEALAAMKVGIDCARKAKEEGFDICVAGEMGIANTTTSAAVLSCLLNEDPADVTGRGAGLDSSSLQNKIRTIRASLATNRPDPSDPIDTLAKVGGLDIAAMTGFYMGCARYRMPVILDGLISLTAALIATRIDPMCSYYLLASHSPSEPGAFHALKALEKEAALKLDMYNGEGTGALLFLPLLRMGLKAYNELATFEEGGVAAYQVLH